MYKLSIIILSWNTKELLRQCLNSLVQSSKACPELVEGFKVQSEIIVVDNGSTDGSVDYVKSITGTTGITGIRLIENKENLGYARGNNIGIKLARGEYIMLLNSDTVIRKGALKSLVDFLDHHSEVDIVGPRLLNIDGSPQANCGRFPLLPVAAVMLFKEHFGGSDLVRCSPTYSGRVEWLMGAAFVAKKKVFDKIGGLDEEFFMYMEEVEWFYRSKLAGFVTYFLKEATIVHLGRGSSKSGKREPILLIYKGLLRFYQIHRSETELVLLKLMLKTKAALALFAGYLRKDQYLIETYGQAIKIS